MYSNVELCIISIVVKSKAKIQRTFVQRQSLVVGHSLLRIGSSWEGRGTMTGQCMLKSWNHLELKKSTKKGSHGPMDEEGLDE